MTVMDKARLWKYPSEEPVFVDYANFRRQTLSICANPEDKALPWEVILEDLIHMYDVAQLTVQGRCIAKVDPSADNYWYPRMWLEVSGRLTISGQTARIEQE